LAVEAEHPVWGKYRRHAPSAHLPLTPGVAGGSGRIGGHTLSILRELGFISTEIQQLKEGIAVNWPE